MFHPLEMEDIEQLPAGAQKAKHTPAVDAPFEWDVADEDE